MEVDTAESPKKKKKKKKAAEAEAEEPVEEAAEVCFVWSPFHTDAYWYDFYGLT